MGSIRLRLSLGTARAGLLARVTCVSIVGALALPGCTVPTDGEVASDDEPAVGQDVAHLAPSPGIERDNVTGFRWDGPYQNHARWAFAQRRSISFDEGGVPMKTYGWGGPYYYPVAVAHYGLVRYSVYAEEDDAAALADALVIGEWFLATQDPSGSWLVGFDLPGHKGRSRIEAPWPSALGQGLALSLLARLYAATTDARYADAIRAAAGPFDVPVPLGGVLRSLDGHVFYEEYPTEPGSFVLNGFISALIGLHAGAQATGSEEIERLYRRGLDTLETVLPLYDLGDATLYDLQHRTGVDYNVAGRGYHGTHVRLLTVIEALEGVGRFGDTIERWRSYLDDDTMPPRNHARPVVVAEAG